MIRDVYPEAFEAADDAVTLQLEMRRLFRQQPVAVAHVSAWDQPTTGSNFITTWLAGMPLVIIREGAGLVRGFLNVCGHRGAVLEEASAGYRAVLECRHHGWRYGLDGAPCGALSKGAAPLRRVAMTVRGGLVWGCIEPGESTQSLPQVESVPSADGWETPVRAPAVTTSVTVRQPWKRVVWAAAAQGWWLAPNVVIGRQETAQGVHLAMVEVIPMLADVSTRVERRWELSTPHAGTPPDGGREAFLAHWRRLMDA